MEFEFDKEIDALLRQTARGGEVVSATGAHLDADEISAFAENALPEKARFRYTAHLADCARCRKILSNLISFEPEAVAVAASSAVKTEIVETKIPWYRRIFAMPNLAYTMSALVLLFSGLIGFIILQGNLGNNSEVSQMSEAPMDRKTANSAPQISQTNTAMNANAATDSDSVYTSNTTTTGTANTSVTNAPVPSSPVNTPPNTMVGESKTLATPFQANEPVRQQELDLAKTETTQTTDLAARKNEKEENKAATENQIRSDDADEIIREVPQPKLAKPTVPSTSGAATNDKKAKTTTSKAAETTSVGGKTFNRRNNVWYDTAYSNQSTTNVRRGSDEYKKLDSGLRGIAENLGGTVVIVWKSKAYRIQ